MTECVMVPETVHLDLMNLSVLLPPANWVTLHASEVVLGSVLRQEEFVMA